MVHGLAFAPRDYGDSAMPKTGVHCRRCTEFEKPYKDDCCPGG
jgi:hypothetical protein